MKVIGHRGAAGLAPENSIASIQAAKAAGVDAVEFDIRQSKDGKLFLCHDPSLERTHDVDEFISGLTTSQIQKIKGPNGDHIPTLEEALTACGNTPVYIEAKGSRWAPTLAGILQSHPKKKNYIVISFNHEALHEFHELCPEIPVYVLEHRNPFDAINAARVYDFNGIDVNYWTLNPLAYLLAKRHKLQVAVFTVDKPWVARLLSWLYKDIGLTTNVPHHMQFLRTKNKRTSKR